MMRKSVIAAASVAIVIGSPARAQEPIAPPPTYISAEFGAQGLLKDLTRQQEGMYTQYRARPRDWTLRSLSARYAPANSARSFELNGTSLGYNDMNLAARATHAGLWDVQFRWDRSPHTYSGQWSTLFTESGTGVWALPATRPANLSAWNSAAQNAVFTKPLRTQWDPIKLVARFTPTEALDSKLEYTFINKAGRKPVSVAWASPGGNSIEALAPIDNTQQDLRLSQAFGGEKYQLQASYNLSKFNNSISSVYVDNQTQATDIATMTSRARVSDMPGNLMQAFNLGGAWKLPYKTRVSGAYTWSVWNQNATFLPAVNNSAITAANLALSNTNPASLGGKAGTNVLNLEVSSRPFDTFLNGLLKGMGLGAKFRRYEFRDNTRVDSVYAFVSDAGNALVEEVGRHPFRREERELSARWAGRYPVAIGVQYEYEMLQNNPEHANVFKTLETGPVVTFDFTGIDWMKFHARYTTLERRAETFSVDGVYKGTWASLPIEYDSYRNPLYADRDRTRVLTMLTVFPVDAVSLTGTFQRGKDTYLQDGAAVQFGYQKYNNSMFGLDADYTPITRLSLNAGYALEKFDDQMRSRYRTPTNVTNNTFIWIGQNVDEVTTYYAGANGIILPNRIEGGIRYEHSFASFLVKGSNPNGVPTGGSASDIANATAADYPEVTQKLEPVNLWVSYKLNAEWSTTVRFQTERYNQNDWRTAFTGPTSAAYRPQIANATTAAGTAPQYVFLGNQYTSYYAPLLTITMTYRPSLLRFGRSAL